MPSPYITLVRPVNFAITAASIAVSCLLAGGTAAQAPVILFASLGGALIGAGGMVINDFFDLEIDRINRPDRPLPSGAVAKFDALMFYAGLTGAGLIMSAYTTRTAFIIAFVAVPVIFLYSQRYKGTPLAGNLIVAGMTALAFIFGGAAVGNLQQAVMPAVFAFLINAGRELIKDMEDVEGDAAHGARTFPVLYGMERSARLAGGFIIAVIASTVVPYVFGLYGTAYFIIVNAVNLLLLYVVVSLARDRSTANLRRLSLMLKWAMVPGLAAIYAG
ncbi:MAG: hypothetical protein F9K22_11790 [Bacteroidetes bacterium]|nr:MAG: hypothetical protein F9K22_11790 [Bacteroidota bacterium]